MSGPSTSWSDRVRTRSRADFRASHAHLFLLAERSLVRPERSMRTVSIDRDMLEAAKRGGTVDESLLGEGAGAEAMVYAVAKRQPTFPAMISIGRTANNDICIEDVQVSKFHALFRVVGDGLELEDAGSRNGTMLDNVRLEKSHPRPVRAGARIAFGELAFELCDADTLWDRLR